jgi:hypothetical protein
MSPKQIPDLVDFYLSEKNGELGENEWYYPKMFKPKSDTGEGNGEGSENYS